MSYRGESAEQPHAPLAYARTYRSVECTVVEVHGEVDIMGVLEVGPPLDEATGGTAPLVVIDLTPTTFLDCSGLALLARAHRRTGERGAALRLVCADPALLRTLHAGGVTDLLTPWPTVGAALRDAAARPRPAASGRTVRPR
ncbi:STAS domain-containing protein [Streptomyces pactum]|uniref:Anti-sigma factor antagonist n=1 Tax=Streptomyces pactum TaxID=68249 RepID=A0ABS0NP13_9ACTN|nr:STAS domain-containing protein [Streptomyces pactum]MBH5336943.1 STAS domain-containing protein [Streptomyces pactum]